MTLTNRDLGAIKDLMEVTIEEKAEHFVTKADIGHLPTKDDFYEKTDELLKEIKDMREEQKVLTNKLPRIKQSLRLGRKGSRHSRPSDSKSLFTASQQLRVKNPQYSRSLNKVYKDHEPRITRVEKKLQIQTSA